VRSIGTFDSSWNEILDPHRQLITNLLDELDSSSDPGYFPPSDLIFRSLSVPRDRVRAIIIGQDPYPTKDMAEGLAFSIPSSVPASKMPASLRNIYAEYQNDLRFPAPSNGHLGEWVVNGVLLLNRILTVAPSAPLSHKGKGWEIVTDSILRSLVSQEIPVIAWGKEGERAAQRIGFTHILSSAHPSPLSAYRGFFGSRPFSKVNEILALQGKDRINWRLK